MTKKHYRALAFALHDLCSVSPKVVDILCEVFQDENKAFDEEKFREAIFNGRQLGDDDK